MNDAPDIFAPGLSASAITERLILGSRPLTPDHLRQLRDEFTVSHILDVCEVNDQDLIPPDNSWADFGYLGYRYNPTADDGQPKGAGWFQESLRFALPLFAQPGDVLYVHCESGMSRSAATVYAILRAWGLGRASATMTIKEARPEALWRYVGDAEVAVRSGW